MASALSAHFSASFQSDLAIASRASASGQVIAEGSRCAEASNAFFRSAGGSFAIFWSSLSTRFASEGTDWSEEGVTRLSSRLRNSACSSGGRPLGGYEGKRRSTSMNREIVASASAEREAAF